MKKIFTILLTLCLMVGAICITAVTASADEPSGTAVMRVAGLKSDAETLFESKDYTSFEDGWNAAVKLATDETYMANNDLIYIVLDLYKDWDADKGSFGSGTGFADGAIEVIDDARMMINMNGHTIDRGKTSYSINGEVLFINDDAELIINGGQYGDPIVEAGADPGAIKMGTIKGGFSCNGAGGIHMDGGGLLVLNNVNLDGNKVEDDDGAAIEALDNSTVIMNGGSISNSKVYLSRSTLDYAHGTVYLEDSTATFKNVEFKHNVYIGYTHASEGTLLYVEDSRLTMIDCLVSENGYKDPTETKANHPGSLILAYGATSVIEATNCRFEKNGDKSVDLTRDPSRNFSLFQVDEATVKVDGCYFDNNGLNDIFYGWEGVIKVKNSHFTNNKGRLLGRLFAKGSHFTNCTFNNNTFKDESVVYCLFHVDTESDIDFLDCDFGNNTILMNYPKANLVDSDAPDGAASIFGEGSLTMIIAMLALASSVAALCVSVGIYKKKTVPATANGAEDSDEE